MQTIYLHIGTHKTATSAIQIFLREHADELAELGFLFPLTGHAPGTKGHHQLAWTLMPKISVKCKLADKSGQELFDCLRQEIQQSRCSNIILSSEEFSLLDIDSLETPLSIHQLARYLEGFDIRVLIYLRRQDEYLSAMYNQIHKSHIGIEIPDKSFEGIKSILDNVMRYDLLLEKWAQVFDEKNIVVSCFESQQYPQGIVQDFLDSCGIPLQAPKAEFVNVSISDDMLAYQRLIESYPAAEESKRALLPLLKKISTTRPQAPAPPAAMRDIVMAYAESNSRVAKKYLGREDGKLFNAPLPDLDESWEPYPGLTTEKAVQISAILIGQIFREIRCLSNEINNPSEIKDVAMDSEEPELKDRTLTRPLWRHKWKDCSLKKVIKSIIRRIAIASGIPLQLDEINKNVLDLAGIYKHLHDVDKNVLGLVKSQQRNLSYVDKGTQILLSILYRSLAREKEILSFDEIEFRNHSQNGEDGIIWYVFSLIGTANKTCVEIGAGDDERCNCANLILNHGWNGFLVDGSQSVIETMRKYYSGHPDTFTRPPKVINAWITTENINELLTSNGVQGEIDILSIDIDGVDYWIWDAIDVISPRVIITEIQAVWGAERSVTVPYSPDFKAEFFNGFGIYSGASLPAFVKLGKQNGYRLVGCQRYGFNAVFMRNDVGQEFFPEIQAQECFNHPFARWACDELRPMVEDRDWEEV